MAPTIGDRIREAREAAGLDQVTLAARIGVNDKTISKWENGHQPIRERNLRKVAEALGRSPEWLLTGVDVTAGRLSGERRPGRVSDGAPVRRLPPRVYERVYGYLERLRHAGADEEQLDIAERTMRQERYARLNKATHREPSEDEMLVDIDAGWAAVWEILTAGGMQIPGPRPRFRKAEEGA